LTLARWNWYRRARQREESVHKRIIMRIDVLPQTPDRLQDTCELFGMTQVSVASQVMKWFCAQSDKVQATVLGLYPDPNSDPTTLALKEMVQEPTRSKKK
jgi:hypothetical protein